jgi:hypothetical protein
MINELPSFSISLVGVIVNLKIYVNKKKYTVTLFQEHWRHLKGNYDLNSAFEKADRLLEQKRTGRPAVSFTILHH